MFTRTHLWHRRLLCVIDLHLRLKSFVLLILSSVCFPHSKPLDENCVLFVYVELSYMNVIMNASQKVKSRWQSLIFVKSLNTQICKEKHGKT